MRGVGGRELTRPVIINADDFALTDAVSAAIVTSLARGVISSTTVMVCVEGAEERVRRLLNPVRQFAGVHLQLTAGQPRVQRERVRTLCDGEGNFIDLSMLEQADPVEAEEEWEEQLRVARSWGLRPTHIDTHHAVHQRSRPLFDAYCRVADRHKLPIRGDSGWVKDLIVQRGLKGSTAVVRHWSGGGGYGALVAELEEVLKKAEQDDVIEIVSHPGVADEELSLKSSLVEERELDLASLNRLQASGLLDRVGLRLASFVTAFET